VVVATGTDVGHRTARGPGGLTVGKHRPSWTGPVCRRRHTFVGVPDPVYVGKIGLPRPSAAPGDRRRRPGRRVAALAFGDDADVGTSGWRAERGAPRVCSPGRGMRMARWGERVVRMAGWPPRRPRPGTGRTSGRRSRRRHPAGDHRGGAQHGAMQIPPPVHA
jgi:hypothetical protein